MRYDSQERLDAWRTLRVWPEIHDDLFHLVLSEARGRRFLDLCCSTGLLGQRLLDKMPGCERVLGLDADAGALERGRDAGVSVPLYHLPITRESLGQLVALVERERITGLVARRCLSEIFAADASWAPEFIDALASGGIREVFIQGRAPTARATHPIPNVDAEISVLGRSVNVLQRTGQCAYLVPEKAVPWD